MDKRKYYIGYLVLCSIVYIVHFTNIYNLEYAMTILVILMLVGRCITMVPFNNASQTSYEMERLVKDQSKSKHLSFKNYCLLLLPLVIFLLLA